MGFFFKPRVELASPPSKEHKKPIYLLWRLYEKKYFNKDIAR